MAIQVRNLVPKDINLSTHVAVSYYIIETNKYENREDFAVFSSFYILYIVAYVSWVENDSRYN